MSPDKKLTSQHGVSDPDDATAANTKAVPITIATVAPGRRANKVVRPCGIEDYDAGARFDYRTETVADMGELEALITRLQDSPSEFLLPHARPLAPSGRRLKHAKADGTQPTIEQVATRLLTLDIDKIELPPGMRFSADPGRAARWVVEHALPPEIRAGDLIVQATSKAGLSGYDHLARVRVFTLMEEPRGRDPLKAWVQSIGFETDHAIWVATTPTYTAKPTFIGMVDPLPVRLWRFGHSAPLVRIPALDATSAAPNVLGAPPPSLARLTTRASLSFDFFLNEMEIDVLFDDMPNKTVDWEEWNNTGLRAYAATKGADYGLLAWKRWSAKLVSDSGTNCDQRWAHFHTHPPTSTGAGALINEARRRTGDKDYLPDVYGRLVQLGRAPPRVRLPDGSWRAPGRSTGLGAQQHAGGAARQGGGPQQHGAAGASAGQQAGGGASAGQAGSGASAGQGAGWNRWQAGGAGTAGQQAGAAPLFRYHSLDSATVDPPEFTIPGLAQRGRVAIIYGSPAVSKTAFLIGAVVAAARGYPFGGPFKTLDACKVLYVAGEEDLNEIRLLASAAMTAQNFTAAHRTQAEQNIGWHTLDDGRFMIGKPNGNTRGVVPEGGDPEWKRLQEAVLSERPALLVMEPVANTIFLEKEVDNTVLAEMLARLNKLAQEADCAILLAHHSSKMGDDAAVARRGDLSAIRGGGGIGGAVRGAAHITPVSDEEARAFELPNPDEWRAITCAKLSNAPKWGTYFLELTRFRGHPEA